MKGVRLGCQAAFLSALLLACNLDNPGVSPPKGVLSYPVALGLSSARNADDEAKFLYVVNSNFDIRFNAASVHAYNLEAIAKAVRAPTAGAGSQSCLEMGVPDTDAGVPDAGTADGGVDGGVELPPGYENATEYGTLRGVLCDGHDPAGYDACCFDDSEQFLKSELLIDSYATGLATRERNDGSDRLYIPLRSKDDLIYLDAKDGQLSCGDGGKHCRREARTDNPNAPGEGRVTQPTAVVVGTLGQVGVTGDRATLSFVSTVHDLGAVSLFVEPTTDAAPLLQDVWFPPGNYRSNSVTLGGADHPVLYVTSSNVSAISQLGVRGAQGPRGRDLLVSGALSGINLTGLSAAQDLRDLAVDPEDSTLLYALVRGGSGGALESVVFLRLDSTSYYNARVIGTTRVGAGPSKLTQAKLGGRRILIVTCYDARAMFIIDAQTRQLIEMVRGLAGPFEMVVDEVRELIYVADFGASVLRVIDARGVADRSLPPPRIIATLGERYYGGGL